MSHDEYDYRAIIIIRVSGVIVAGFRRLQCTAPPVARVTGSVGDGVESLLRYSVEVVVCKRFPRRAATLIRPDHPAITSHEAAERTGVGFLAHHPRHERAAPASGFETSPVLPMPLRTRVRKIAPVWVP